MVGSRGHMRTMKATPRTAWTCAPSRLSSLKRGPAASRPACEEIIYIYIYYISILFGHKLMSDESLLVFASKRSPGLWVNLQSRQESTMDGHRYRHVLCRTGHSNNLEDALVEDSALTRSCCIASLQFVLKLPLKTFLILTFLSKSNKKHTRTRTCQRAFSGSANKGHL